MLVVNKFLMANVPHCETESHGESNRVEHAALSRCLVFICGKCLDCSGHNDHNDFETRKLDLQSTKWAKWVWLYPTKSA